MKRLFVLSLGAGLALLCNVVLAQENETKTNAAVKIRAEAAKDNVGKQAVVSGKVAEINKAEQLVRLNIDKPYPKQPFTAVIFRSNTNRFGDLEQLKGKTIEVSGKITDFRGRPQIILTSADQLKVIEAKEEKK